MGAHRIAELDSLSRGERERLIRNAPLSDVDRYIAIRYACDCTPHCEIAAEVAARFGIDRDRSAITRRWISAKQKILSQVI